MSNEIPPRENVSLCLNCGDVRDGGPGAISQTPEYRGSNCAQHGLGGRHPPPRRNVGEWVEAGLLSLVG